MIMRDRPTILIPGSLPNEAVVRIADHFEVVRVDSTDPRLITEELAHRIRGIGCGAQVTSQFIDALPNLEIIASLGVGYDGIDVEHTSRKGVTVTNTPDVLSEEVADTAIGLLINVVRELPKAEAWLRDRRWQKQGPYPPTSRTLRGRSVGIFGLGRIGECIARRIEAFGLPVSYHNRQPRSDLPYSYYGTLAQLAASVDTLIAVAPGGPSTYKAVNAEVFTALGSDGIFINVGRGSTVDEEALIAALQNGTIGAAGLDVYANEPHVPEDLLALDNVSLLPHVAAASAYTRAAVANLLAENLISWFIGDRALTPVSETAHVRRRN